MPPDPLTKEQLALLQDRAERVVAQAAAIAYAVDNIVQATDDGEAWVATDNLRRLPAIIGQLWFDAARMFAAFEEADKP